MRRLIRQGLPRKEKKKQNQQTSQEELQELVVARAVRWVDGTCPPQLHVDVSIAHLHATACKTLLTGVQRQFSKPLAYPSVSSDFEATLKEVRHYFRTHKGRQWRMQKSFESLTGVSSGS